MTHLLSLPDLFHSPQLSLSFLLSPLQSLLPSLQSLFSQANRSYFQSLFTPAPSPSPFTTLSQPPPTLPSLQSLFSISFFRSKQISFSVSLHSPSPFPPTLIHSHPPATLSSLHFFRPSALIASGAQEQHSFPCNSAKDRDWSDVCGRLAADWPFTSRQD